MGDYLSSRGRDSCRKVRVGSENPMEYSILNLKSVGFKRGKGD